MQNILELCNKSAWRGLGITLEQNIKAAPDNASSYTQAAHVALRQGKTDIANWLLGKAQGIEPANPHLAIEDICLSFYEANYEYAYRKLSPKLLESAAPEHPIYLIAAYLCCIYNDASVYKDIKIEPRKNFEGVTILIKNYLSITSTETTATWNEVGSILNFLEKGDKLLASIHARFSELLFPAKADSYAALGIFNLHAGFYKNAERNFHEAIFRETGYLNLIKLQQFYLFCRQQRFIEAINLALELEKIALLDTKGQAFLLEASLRAGQDFSGIKKRLELIQKHLRDCGQTSPYIEVAAFRIKLKDKQLSEEDVTKQLLPYIKHPECHAAYLYLYAALIADNNLAEAKQYAARATALDALHPDAYSWDKNTRLNFEYAGMFIPKDHEGGAWPTAMQLELLDILFLTPDSKLAKQWQSFTAKQKLYSLEAGAARLLPFIYKKLSSILPANEIKEIDLLKGIWKKSYFENALQMKNILGVVKKLEENGIKVTLLKGMANAISLYGDIGSRPMSDIDILIEESDLQPADEFLRLKGWNCKDNYNKNRVRFSYASTYRHSNGSIIDLHWRPCENLNADYYDISDIGELQYTEFSGYKFRTLSPTINLLCTILHGVEWNHLTPVRWVSDSLLILQKFQNQINWQHIYKLAEQYHCLPILASGLQFLTRYNKIFAESLPEELKQAMTVNYDNDVFMKIRLQPRNLLSSFEEAHSILEHYKKRFSFKENDYLFICGGDKPEYIKSQCEKKGINWAPYADHDVMQKIKPAEAPYNYIAIDANLSCIFQCFSVRV